MSDERTPGSGDLSPPATDAVTSGGATPPAAAPAAPEPAAAPPPPGAPVAEKPAGTLASGAEPPKAEDVKPDWPDDWRTKLAGEDEKALKRLNRFNSPADIFKSFRELEAKMSSGKAAKAELPDNATEEQIAEFRKANGVPADGKYDTSLVDGFVWGDADKPVLEDFAKHAHEMNMPQSEFKKALAWYATYQSRIAEQQNERDAEYHVQNNEALRQEFGSEYKRNINAMGALFADLEPEVQDAMFSARLPDGTILGDNPALVKFWVRVARELNPAATLVPPGTNDPMGSLKEERTAIEAEMSKTRAESKYWSGPGAATMQARYREIIEAEQKLKGRAA